jgi:hypothetical protein
LISLFSQCVTETLRLIHAQIALVESQGARVTSVVLSGGFSVNKYLHSQVKALCDSYSMRIFTADEEQQRWTAVAKGAVLMGLGIGCEQPPEVHKCPVHIGVVLAPRFSAFDHDQRQRYVDSFDHQARAKAHIHWVVAMGDPIPTNGVFQKSVKVVRKLLAEGLLDGNILIVTSRDTSERGPFNCTHAMDCEFHLSGPVPHMLTSLAATREVHRLGYTLENVNQDSDLWQNHKQRSAQGNMTYYKLEMQLELVVTPEQATASLIWGQTTDMLGNTGAAGYLLGNAVIPLSRYAAA